MPQLDLSLLIGQDWKRLLIYWISDRSHITDLVYETDIEGKKVHKSI